MVIFEEGEAVRERFGVSKFWKMQEARKSGLKDLIFDKMGIIDEVANHGLIVKFEGDLLFFGVQVVRFWQIKEARAEIGFDSLGSEGMDRLFSVDDLGVEGSKIGDENDEEASSINRDDFDIEDRVGIESRRA